MDKFEGWKEYAAAENAWEIELRATFGNEAGTKRYEPAGKGEPNSRLRAAYEARREAQNNWFRLAPARALQA